jgi:hypothetical protein
VDGEDLAVDVAVDDDFGAGSGGRAADLVTVRVGVAAGVIDDDGVGTGVAVDFDLAVQQRLDPPAADGNRVVAVAAEDREMP